MGALFVVLPDHVIHKERLTAARRPQYKLISVCYDSLFHREVGYIQMQGFTADTVAHLDTERAWRILIIGFLREETECRFDKGVERFFRREIPRVAGHSRPIKGCRIHRVVAWAALHECKL